MASLFIGFLVEKYVACQSIGYQISDGIVFVFRPCLMRKTVAKSEAILALLDTFQELHLEGKPE